MTLRVSGSEIGLMGRHFAPCPTTSHGTGRRVPSLSGSSGPLRIGLRIPPAKPRLKWESVTRVSAAFEKSGDTLSCALCGLGTSEVPNDCGRCDGRVARELTKLPTSPSRWRRDDPFPDLTPQSAGAANRQVRGGSSADPFSEWRQELFRSPIVPLTYETLLPALWSAGLRDKGIEDEKKQVLSCFRNLAGTVADVSCGTGLMARALSASGQFDTVIAIDFSENMLQQTIAGAAREGLSKPGLQVVRGDVMRLPLVDASCDAVYAGAAMHCWPDAEGAMAEIYRVMKPGARLYATTFLRPFPDLVFRFFTVQELEGVCLQAGFQRKKFHVQGRGVYGIITAEK